MLNGMPWHSSLWGNDDHRLVFLGADAVLCTSRLAWFLKIKPLNPTSTGGTSYEFIVWSLPNFFHCSKVSPAVSWSSPAWTQSITEWQVKVSVSRRREVESVSWRGEKKCPFILAMAEQWRSQPYNGADLGFSVYLYNFFRFARQISGRRTEWSTKNCLEKLWEGSQRRSDS